MSDAASDQQDLNVNYRISLISFTLLYYEYFLTLEAEITRMWAHRTLTAPTIIFYLNRYVAFFGNLPIIVQNFWAAEPSEHKRMMCLKLQTYHQYFAVLVQIIVGVMLILRTYALYECNKKVLAVMVIYTVYAVVYGFWAVSFAKSDEDTNDFVPYIGCPSTVGLATAWITMLIFDTMIFFLTLYKALRNGRGNLTRLLPDFSVMIALNIGNIITFFDFTRGMLTTLTNVMSSIFTSRLMLNLRDPALFSGPSNSTTANSGAPAHSLLSSIGPSFGFNDSPLSSRQTQNWDNSYRQGRSLDARRSRERGSAIDEESSRQVTNGEEEIELQDIQVQPSRQHPG
ncbi:hypothetical protein L218DRAFT_968454 [Marasmius fiardii PR-910]|nr:hypothetical protein L218DRAFT_968454 [Marasmius fiardii PR-910]